MTSCESYSAEGLDLESLLFGKESSYWLEILGDVAVVDSRLRLKNPLCF